MSHISHWEISDYSKAIQVRDPYERLLSAYRLIFELYNNKNSSKKWDDLNNLNRILLRKYHYLPAAKVFFGLWIIFLISHF